MSTLRISNIEAKSVPASATIDEKVKITNSSGDTLVFLDGKTSGITTVGINTTDGNITFDANSNVVVTGIITATRFSGQITPTSLEIGSNIKLGNAGVITATSFVGSGANLTSLPSQLTLSNNADNRVITGGSGTNLNGEADFTYDGDNCIISRAGNSLAGLTVRNTNNSQANAISQITVSGGDNSYAALQLETNGQEHKIYQLNTGQLGIEKAGVERLRIDSTGRTLVSGTFGFGNMPLSGNAANAALQIRCQSQYQGIAFGEGATNATIGRGANNAALIYTANANPANLGGGTKVIHEWHSGTAGGSGPGRYMALDTDGDLTLDAGSLKVASGQGIDFSATANSSGSMGSELLDDYEEGSWTPYIRTTNNTTQPSYNHQLGLYTKVGRLVTWMARVNTSGELSTGSGATEMWGFPYAAMTWGGNGDWPGGGEIVYYYNLRGGYGTNPRILGPYNNATFLRFHTFSNQTDISTNAYNIFFTNNTLLIMTGQYYTA